MLFSSIISKLEIIATHGGSLSTISELCAANNSISELYLDFEHQDYTKDLKRFFNCYPGSNLKVLEINRMDEPIELDALSESCPNLNKLKIMLCGVWQEDKLFWMYFSRLTSLHIKTSSTETLLSFMKYNISVSQMKISCPNEVKSKFNDAFIQTACSRKGRVGNGFFQNLYHLSTTPGLDTVLRAALPQLRSYTRTCKLGCC